MKVKCSVSGGFVTCVGAESEGQRLFLRVGFFQDAMVRFHISSVHVIFIYMELLKHVKFSSCVRLHVTARLFPRH